MSLSIKKTTDEKLRPDYNDNGRFQNRFLETNKPNTHFIESEKNV